MAIPHTEPPQGPPDRRPLRRTARVVRGLSWFVLIADLLILAIIDGVSEQTWWGTLCTFLPRQPLLFAPLALLIAACRVHRRSIATNVIAIAVVIGPLMGLHVPLSFALPRHAGRTLKVLSCNIHGYHPDFKQVLREVKEINPDVVVLQEVLPSEERAARSFEGWNFVARGEYWIGSRYPIKLLGATLSLPFRRIATLSALIDAPGGAFVVHDVHLTTPRFGLIALNGLSVWSGRGPRSLEEYTKMRRIEAQMVSDALTRFEPSLPTIVAGDFNTPTVSDLYQDCWSQYTNAFEVAGLGFGYTCPCMLDRPWLDRLPLLPWVRIDHVLVDSHWSVKSCHVGDGKGSDHRLIWAELARE